jgi:hypothetical protein
MRRPSRATAAHYKVEERLRQINLGGTAVGTGAAADRRYAFRVRRNPPRPHRARSRAGRVPDGPDPDNDVFVEVSGLLKACAVNALKLSNDLRLLASVRAAVWANSPSRSASGGVLHACRARSNPVIPECVAQCAHARDRQRPRRSRSPPRTPTGTQRFHAAQSPTPCSTRLSLLCAATDRSARPAWTRSSRRGGRAPATCTPRPPPALCWCPTSATTRRPRLPKKSLATGTSIRELAAARALLPVDVLARLFPQLGVPD